MLRRHLSTVDRRVATVLAVVWLVGGAAGFVAGVVQGSLSMLVVSALAIVWGIAWATVARRRRLLESAVGGPPRQRQRGR